MISSPILITMLTMATALAVGFVLKLKRAFRTTGYVYVGEDGSWREVTEDEREYILMSFLPGDGARPYIKDNYRQRTPSGARAGFMLKRKLPERLLR